MGSKTQRIDPQVYLFYLIYLIPIFSIITILLEITDKNTKVAGFIAGLIPIVAMIYALTQAGTNVFAGMAIGAYLTLVGAIAMILVIFGFINMPKQTQSRPDQDKVNE
jgi:hypothetical protein